MRYLLLVILSMSFNTVLSQVAYYDVLDLKEFSAGPDTDGKVVLNAASDRVFEILSNYYPEAIEKDDIDLSTNPFIKFGTEPQGDPLEKVSTAFERLGGLDVTKFADGFAKFLVARTKEELNVAFFRNLKKALANYPEFSALFPKTADFIVYIEEQNYASMLQVLKNAFEEDVRNLLGNIPDLSTIECGDDHGTDCQTRVKKITDFFQAEGGWSVMTISLFANQMINGDNVADALTSVVNNETLKNEIDLKEDSDRNLENHPITFNAFKLLELFSTSFRYKDDTRIWVESDDIVESILEKKIERTLYLGLIYQLSEDNKIRFPKADGSTVEFAEILKEFKGNHDKLKSILKTFIDSFKQIEKNLLELKKLRDENKDLNLITINNYLDGISNTFDVIDKMIVVSSSGSNAIDLSGISDDVKKLENAVRRAIDISNDLQERNYGSVIFNVTLLLDTYATTEEIEALKEKLLKYGTFIATVAQAEDSDQVASAIEAFALPSGSSSIKRKSSFNVALNAYVGPRYGKEDDGGEDDTVFGITSPIGISTSFGNWGGDKPFIQGLTVFVSVIDVGAFTTYRFDDDNADDEGLPETSLQNLFAPGAHLFLNFGNVPLSFGGGFQYGPTVRELSATTSSSGLSYHVALVVDIPLINLYTRSK